MIVVMKSLIAYTDGSQINVTNMTHVGGKIRSLIKISSSAFRIAYEGIEEEFTYTYDFKQNPACPELMAICQTFLFAFEHDYTPSQVSIYTDYQNFVNFQYTLHSRRNSPYLDQYPTVMKIKELCSIMDWDCEVMIAYMKNSRIRWVKAHHGCIYNNRVDYLARTTAKGVYDSNAKVLHYDTWMLMQQTHVNPHHGFVR